MSILKVSFCIITLLLALAEKNDAIESTIDFMKTGRKNC